VRTALRTQLVLTDRSSDAWSGLSSGPTRRREVSYTSTVDRLRDMTRNRDALAANAVSDLPPAGSAPDPEALDEQARATYGTVRPMEDAELRALGLLYLRTHNYDAVARAIDEAGASWLYPVMLDWSLDSLTGQGDDE
jgi:hypothetical protein